MKGTLMMFRDRQLTKNIRLAEMAISYKHPEIAAGIGFTELEITKLFYLCYFILQPVRDAFNEPLVITSGKRTSELNKLVGGVEDSQHVYCEAVDFFVKRTPLPVIFLWLHKYVRWHQLYLKIENHKSTLIHVSLVPPDGRYVERRAFALRDGVYVPFKEISDEPIFK